MLYTLFFVFYFKVVLSRIAPLELCYADPKENTTEPTQLPTGEQSKTLIPVVTNGYVEYSKGCELRLLDTYVNVSSRPEKKVNATIGWSFDLGCQIPLIYREYYNCTGNIIPSPETCDGYSLTLVKSESISSYALVNVSLLIQPGIFDSGRYLYSLVFGNDSYNGRIEVRVDNETDYPCFMMHGLTVKKGDKLHIPYKPSTNPNHKRYRGCFPISNTELWNNISDESVGRYSYDEEYEEYEEENEDFEDLQSKDCRKSNLFDMKKTFNLAAGSQSLLIASLGKSISEQPWSFKINESYELFNNLSITLQSEEDSNILNPEIVTFTTPPPTENTHMFMSYNETMYEEESVLSIIQLFNNGYNNCNTHIKVIGFGTIIFIILFFVAVFFCGYTCVLNSRIKMINHAYIQPQKLNFYDI
ncbi:envelope glycoprotein G [Canid alphaherpesvirus 1]|nr:envelope glycoprotein G [Canid alphaherpesvirus 1]QQL08448.1 envelope glycoprotein G [Canid alphaherpesvirus 1]WHU31637.1 envelope glycoprotein G [Canid alphaherpesvirus 1]WHU31711.1 envelope glycoprotein G [Canid alphaherpesvirus 1]